METKRTKTCAECGRVFVPTGPRQIYCMNMDCPKGRHTRIKSESYYKCKDRKKLGDKVVAHCKVCGKAFLADSLAFKFCSEECKREQKRYMNRKQYAKRMGLPEPPTPLELKKQKEERAKQINEAIAKVKAEHDAPKTFENRVNNIERRKPMYENRINTINKKPHYTPEEVDVKMTAKTKRILDTIHTLEGAGINEDVIFEAVKSITRMPLNKF